MLYDLVRDGDVVQSRDFAPDQAPQLAPNKGAWLPREVIDPPFDPAREVKTGPVVTIEPSRVVYSYTVAERPLGERQAQMRADVNALRDQKLRQPFPFLGKTFDYDDNSQKRITGAGALAHIAVTVGGKLPDDPRWHGGDEDFVWIAADNSLVPMDAQTVLAFGQAAGAWESAHIFTARALKDAIDAAPDHDALDAIDIEAGWEG